MRAKVGVGVFDERQKNRRSRMRESECGEFELRVHCSGGSAGKDKKFFSIDVMPFWEQPSYFEHFFNIEMRGSGSASNLQVR